MNNGPISGVRIKAAALTSPAAPQFYRVLGDVPEGSRVFQVSGIDCEHERFRLYITAGREETDEQVLERAREIFDDSWVSSVDEEDIEWEGAAT